MSELLREWLECVSFDRERGQDEIPPDYVDPGDDLHLDEDPGDSADVTWEYLNRVVRRPTPKSQRTSGSGRA